MGGCASYQPKHSYYLNNIGKVVGAAYLDGNKYVGTFPIDQTNIPKYTEFITLGTNGYQLSSYTEHLIRCPLIASTWSIPSSPGCSSYFYAFDVTTLPAQVLANGILAVVSLGTFTVANGGFIAELNFNAEKFDNFIIEHKIEEYRQKFIALSDEKAQKAKREEIAKDSLKERNYNLNDFYIILDATEAMNENDSDGMNKFAKAKQSIYDLAYKLDNQKINLGLIVCAQTCHIAVHPTSNFKLVSNVLDFIKAGGKANINEAFELIKNSKSLFLLVANKNINTAWLDKFKKRKTSVYAINYGNDSKFKANFDRYGFVAYSANSNVVLNEDVRKILEKTSYAKQSWADGDYTFDVKFDFNDDKIKDEYINVIAEFAKNVQML